MIDVVAFDGDDTLWHSESLFAVTQERVAELLAPDVDAATLERELVATERRNLAVYGYGVKGFTLSLIETVTCSTRSPRSPSPGSPTGSTTWRSSPRRTPPPTVAWRPRSASTPRGC